MHCVENIKCPSHTDIAFVVAFGFVLTRNEILPLIIHTTWSKSDCPSDFSFLSVRIVYWNYQELRWQKHRFCCHFRIRLAKKEIVPLFPLTEVKATSKGKLFTKNPADYDNAFVVIVVFASAKHKYSLNFTELVSFPFLARSRSVSGFRVWSYKDVSELYPLLLGNMLLAEVITGAMISLFFGKHVLAHGFQELPGLFSLFLGETVVIMDAMFSLFFGIHVLGHGCLAIPWLLCYFPGKNVIGSGYYQELSDCFCR